MNIKVNKEKNNTYKIDVTVESKKVDEAFEEALKHEAENVDIKGFRKGKAPLNVVKENADKANLRSHALNHLLQKIYTQIINEYKLKPIVYPKFDIKEFDEQKDLKLVVIIVESPEIKLGDYKKEIEKITISVSENEPQDIASKIHITNQKIIEAVLKTCTVEVSEELVNEELNRMMSSIIDQTAKMGITVDQYLESIKKTPEQLRSEYKEKAISTLNADFLLTEISKQEKIEVSDGDVQKTIQAIPDDKSREQLAKPEQQMYIKAVLLKNKTLQKLSEYIKKSETESNSKPKDSSEKDDSEGQKKEKK